MTSHFFHVKSFIGRTYKAHSLLSERKAERNGATFQRWCEKKHRRCGKLQVKKEMWRVGGAEKEKDLARSKEERQVGLFPHCLSQVENVS